jgi:hypothetical protein
MTSPAHAPAHAPASPTDTCVSSSTGGTPPAVDAKLAALLELVKRTVGAKRELDREEACLMQEGNRIGAKQAALDEQQEALDGEKQAFEKRQKTAERAREAYLDDMHCIDERLTRPDRDDDDGSAGAGLVGGFSRNR